MSLKADDVKVYKPKRQRKPKKRRDNARKAEELRAKVKVRMESMVRSKEYIGRYSTLQGHVDALNRLYGKAPELNKQMSLDELKQLHVDIKQEKYGKLV